MRKTMFLFGLCILLLAAAQAWLIVHFSLDQVYLLLSLATLLVMPACWLMLRRQRSMLLACRQEIKDQITRLCRQSSAPLSADAKGPLAGFRATLEQLTRFSQQAHGFIADLPTAFDSFLSQLNSVQSPVTALHDTKGQFSQLACLCTDLAATTQVLLSQLQPAAGPLPADFGYVRSVIADMQHLLHQGQGLIQSLNDTVTQDTAQISAFHQEVRTQMEKWLDTVGPIHEDIQSTNLSIKELWHNSRNILSSFHDAADAIHHFDNRIQNFIDNSGACKIM